MPVTGAGGGGGGARRRCAPLLDSNGDRQLNVMLEVEGEDEWSRDGSWQALNSRSS